MMDAIVLQESSSSTSTAYGGGGESGGRAIDRHNPIIRDEKRLGQGRIFPLSSPTTHPDHHRHQKKLKDTAKKDADPAAGGGDRKKKSIAFIDADDDREFINRDGFMSPATSSRCLLSEKATFDFSSEFDHVPPSPPPPPPPPPLPRGPLISHNYFSADFKKKDDDLFSSPPHTPQPPPSPPPTENFTFFNDDDDDDDDSLSSSPPKPPPPPPPEFYEFYNYKASNRKRQDLSYPTTQKPSSPPPPPPPPSNKQVIVLEVSLHCRGCERKMRKHISKIEEKTSYNFRVTSFKIEFAAKKVTVVGDVTPLAVLNTVLKVKNAKLLTPATISSPSSVTDSNPGF
ncbi:hypothetical protein OSB04_013644 [Centaurea solstitialis]|uniref:HMA domain-containing protein n=1 Tax=Centaurea solstitialis TaxID=347529 RepID=A0AA38TQD1_9ASTR|nr:hypothetical protein OSB04_013644 [Centaurea solstitialis]